MPRVWGSRYNQSGIKGYKSNTGEFALNSFAAGRSHHLSTNRPQGKHDHTDRDSHSDASARLVDDNGRQGIMMRKEFSVKVNDGETSTQDHVAPFSQV